MCSGVSRGRLEPAFLHSVPEKEAVETEIAQCLPCEHEDQNSLPSTHIKSLCL